jgi:serine/threonine-protein kinase HipA
VIDEEGALWIAKFPSVKDRTDIGAWEMVVNELAEVNDLYRQFRIWLVK